MVSLFVGQRVRLRSSAASENIGREGVVLAIGMWGHLDILPDGVVLEYPGKWVDTYVKWDYPILTTNGCTVKDCGVESFRIDPILPEGAQPSEFSFTELMDNLGVVVA